MKWESSGEFAHEAAFSDLPDYLSVYPNFGASADLLRVTQRAMLEHILAEAERAVLDRAAVSLKGGADYYLRLGPEDVTP